MSSPPNNKHLFLYLFILIGSILMYSCNKPTLIGKNLLPGEDDIYNNFTDTLTIITNTVREDSVRTDNFSAYLLGTMNDPVFGKSFADIYTQVLLPADNVDLRGGDSLAVLTLDSAVLTLSYNGFYGDKNAAQTVIVYQLNESMYDSAAYYSNKTFTAGNEVGRLDNFIPNTTDSVEEWGVKYAPHLRIRLTQAFGDNLLAQSGTSNFQNQPSFLNYLKGLYIATDTNSSGKGIMYLNLSAAISKLTLYYKKDTADSLTYSFGIGTGAATANYFRHNFSGSTVEAFLNNPNANGDTMVFVQPLSGVKTKIKLPYLQILGKILVTKAELVITEINSDTVFFTSPSKLLCKKADSTGAKQETIDELYNNFFPGHFGGTKTAATVNNTTVNEYRFRLTLHLQKVINESGVDDYGLFLVPSSEQAADRLVAGGGNHSQYRMKLNLVYTKL